MPNDTQQILTTCQTLCDIIRTLIPISPNLDKDVASHIALTFIRYKSQSVLMLKKLDALKNKNQYHLTKRQFYRIIFHSLEQEKSPKKCLEIARISRIKSPKTYFELKAYLAILHKTLFTSQTKHNDGTFKNIESVNEQHAKRTLRLRTGNCDELVEVLRTYLKIFSVTGFEIFTHVVLSLHDHVLLMLFPTTDTTKPFLPDYFSDLSELATFMERENKIGYLLDPWLNQAVLVSDFEKLLTDAETRQLRNYFLGSIKVAHDTKHSCLSKDMFTALSDRHQCEEKAIKYIDAFFPIFEQMRQSREPQRSPVKKQSI